MDKPDIDELEQDLIAALERGGGQIRAEYWQPMLRLVLGDDAAHARLKGAALAWRSTHGIEGDSFIVGVAM